MNQHIILPDGRHLGYSEYGESDGHPVFYFHGTPSARVEWELFGTDELTSTFRLRIIAVDRPGMGLSDFQRNRRMTDWPGDVTALADHLSLDRFGVIGFSGGTAYAAACALQIPDRLTAVGLVATIAPFDQPGLTDGISPQGLQFMEASRDRPRLARFVQRLMALTARFLPKVMIAQALRALPKPDRDVMAPRVRQQAFVRMIGESMRRGPRGVQLDTALMVSPWGFDPADIGMPLHIWKGQLDENAPVAMAHYMAAAIRESRLTVYPEDGHLSIMVHHIEEILRVFGPAGERPDVGR